MPKRSTLQKRDRDGLTPKQARFVAEYLVDSNGTQAAIRAGYSANSANEQASRLLAHANISNVIRRKRERLQSKVDLSIEGILTDLKQIVDECKATGKLRDSHAAIKGLNLLGKHLGMFSDKLQVEGAVTIEIISGIDTPVNGVNQ